MKPREPMCDWLSFRHDFAIEAPGPIINSGSLLRIDPDGVIEWQAPSWAPVVCPSSDTSVRVKCDGRALYFSGNPGRFGQPDNREGMSVADAFDRAVEIIARVFPETRWGRYGLGSVFREGMAGEYGTRLTRLDLCANYDTDSYANLALALSARRIGQRRAEQGLYGPTWGYTSKRAQFWRAKLYDKSAELEGRRTPTPGATLARFEVQLGSEYLRQGGLSRLAKWGGDMGQVVFGKFAEQLFRESACVEDWTSIPVRLRSHAIMWRDGVDVRSYMTRSTFYRTRSQLMDYGVDIGQPCNVLALVRRVRVVEVAPVNNIRRAA